MYRLCPWIVFAVACQTGAPCETSSDCRDNEVCAEATCTYAFNRFYDVVLIEAEVPETDGNANKWDPEGGPDVYAETGFSGEPDGCFSQTVFDTTTPYWEEICPIWVPDHGSFLINLWEEDVGEEDDAFIAGFYWEGAASFIEVLRTDGDAMTVRDEYDVASIQFTVLP